MDLGLKAFCPDYKKYVKIRSLLQTPFGTSTIPGTEKLHTSVVSDQKEKNSGARGHAPSDVLEAITVHAVILT